MTARSQPKAPTTPPAAVVAATEKVSPVETASAAIIAAITASDATAEKVAATITATVRPMNAGNRQKVLATVVGSAAMVSPLAPAALAFILSAPSGTDPRVSHAATFASIAAEYAAAVVLMSLAGLPIDNGTPNADQSAAALAAVEKRFIGRSGGERASIARTLAELAAISPKITLRSDAKVTATVTTDAVKIGTKSYTSLTAATQGARGNEKPVNGWVEWRTAANVLAGDAVDAARIAVA